MTTPAADSPLMQNAHLQLMLRPSCLLCLEAEYVLSVAGIEDFERVDIERDPVLEERYGTRIPVLRDPLSRQELDWPFGMEQLHIFAG